MLKKISFTLTLIVCLLAASLTVQAAAQYPSKPIHIVVPWAAGGGTDLIARPLVDIMKGMVNVPIVIDNITGAGGATGNKAVADATPDGYTVLLNGDTDILAAITMVQGGYDLDSFKYIGGVYYSPTWIMTHKDSGINSVEEFLSKAKASPGKLVLGSTTPAGAQMVMCAAIQSETKAPFRIIPFQGGKDMTKSLLGNQVEAAVVHAPVMLNEVKAGLIKIIGTGGSLKNCTYEPLRDMKTLEELGIPVAMGIYRGVMVPKNTPDDVVKKLTELVKAATLSKEFAEFGERFGFAPQWCDGAEYEKSIRAQLPQFEHMR